MHNAHKTAYVGHSLDKLTVHNDQLLHLSFAAWNKIQLTEKMTKLSIRIDKTLP
jgi:hypothetical protein